jgi:hypothetical protein
MMWEQLLLKAVNPPSSNPASSGKYQAKQPPGNLTQKSQQHREQLNGPMLWDFQSKLWYLWIIGVFAVIKIYGI